MSSPGFVAPGGRRVAATAASCSCRARPRPGSRGWPRSWPASHIRTGRRSRTRERAGLRPRWPRLSLRDAARRSATGARRAGRLRRDGRGGRAHAGRAGGRDRDRSDSRRRPRAGSRCQPAVARLIDRVDSRGDGHRRLGPLDAVGVREIAQLYAGADVRGGAARVDRARLGRPARTRARSDERLGRAGGDQAARRRRRVSRDASAAGAAPTSSSRTTSSASSSRGSTAASEGPVETDAGECPYKGLASFEEEDARLFFGRERLVGELAARTVGAGLLAVVGASGSGKSSVIAAGLLPSLRAGLLPGSERWRSVVIRPGEHPLAALDSLSISDREVRRAARPGHRPVRGAVHDVSRTRMSAAGSSSGSSPRPAIRNELSSSSACGLTSRASARRIPSSPNCSPPTWCWSGR